MLAIAVFRNEFPDYQKGVHQIGEYVMPKRGKGLLSKNAIYGDVPVIAGGLRPTVFHNESNTRPPVLTISSSGANAGYVSLWQIPIWSSDSSFIDYRISKDVFFWYTLLKLRQKEIFDAQTGSAQPHIYPVQIGEMPIAELSVEFIRNLNCQVEPFYKLLGANQRENEKLSKLRDTLLPKLMSGEIDVSQVDITQLNNHLCMRTIVICAYLDIPVQAIILCRLREGVAMSVPKYDDMMLPVLICLSQKPEAGRGDGDA